MTPEEREKAIQIMAERYTRQVSRSSDKQKGYKYATFHYNRYSDEALLSLIFNHTDLHSTI